MRQFCLPKRCSYQSCQVLYTTKNLALSSGKKFCWDINTFFSRCMYVKYHEYRTLFSLLAESTKLCRGSVVLVRGYEVLGSCFLICSNGNDSSYHGNEWQDVWAPRLKFMVTLHTYPSAKLYAMCHSVTVSPQNGVKQPYYRAWRSGFSGVFCILE